MNTVDIRPAHRDDLTHIYTLLDTEGLPTEGVAEHLEQFLVAVIDGDVVGAIGLEVYGNTALLRSAVVPRRHQRKGVGTLLTGRILAQARHLGVQRVVLLTNTAEEWFRHKGFRSVDPASITGPVRSSVEFTGACPSHAVAMELTL